MIWHPSDILSQLRSLAPADCPYCQVWPSIPCVAHQPRPEREPEQLKVEEDKVLPWS